MSLVPSIMADQQDLYPEASTIKRSEVVRGLIQRTFAVTFNHLSRLQGKTIEQFCKDANFYHIKDFFKYEEKSIIKKGNIPVETYDAHLLHKLLKHCCGLTQHRDPVWQSGSDTIEFLITCCWTEYKSLGAASEMTDSTLNHHMDEVLKSLVSIIEKVEDQKKVDISDLKSELIKHIGEKLDMNNDLPIAHHIYTIFSQHSVHVMLIIVYRELNNLKGTPLSTFLNSKGYYIPPQTVYSNENEFLEQDPSPENMSISVLYKVVQRVCFSYSRHQRRKEAGALQLTLEKLTEEYIRPPASEEEYREKSYKIYKLLETALLEVTKKKRGMKALKKIIQDLPAEPYVVKSFRKPYELPCSSMQPVSVSPAPSPHGPVQPVSTPPTPTPHFSNQCSGFALHAPSQAMAAASTTASAPSTFTQEQLNVVVLFSVLCPEGVVVEVLAFVFRALKGSVARALKDSKKTFTTDEKERLGKCQDNIDSLASKDVTLMGKLLRRGCVSLSDNDRAWAISEHTLESYIIRVKNERNNLSHDVSAIETADLNQTLKTIKTYLNIILEMTEKKLDKMDSDMKKDLQRKKDEVNSKMNEIAQSTPHAKYYWTMEKLKEDMTGKIKRDARMELQKPHLCRENLLNMSPLSGNDDTQQSLTTKDVYVNREFEDMSDIKAEGSWQMKDILFCQGNDLASSRVFVIHGGHGEGKTSVCKHAYHLWSENLDESSKKGVELLIYIPCRFVTTKSISSYLKERLPKTFSHIEKDDIIPLMQEVSVVFVIDGFDEAGGEAKSLTDDILTSLPDSKVIITTKTQWLSKLKYRVKRVTSCFKVLTMVEVTDNMRQEFIRKIFKAVGTNINCDEFLEYLNEVKEKNYALICRPLTFCLLAQLWIKNPKKAKGIKTLTQLYYTLYDLILERVSEKLDKNKFVFQEWMIILGKIAWDNLKNNQHHLNNYDLTTLMKRASGLEPDDHERILSSLLQCDEDQDSLSDAKRWTFMITSQQEYFAAVYIVDCIIEKNSSLREMLELTTEEQDDKYKKKLQRLLPVIKFVCGLIAIYEKLTKDKVKEIAELMSVREPWAFMAVTSTFEPLLKKPGVEQIVKTLFMNQEMSTFENYDPLSIVWVLKHTSLTVLNPVTLRNTVSELPNVEQLLKFFMKSNSKSYSVKVMVDVDKVSNISPSAVSVASMKHKDIMFTFIPQKPLCIAQLLQHWVWSSPLCLFLCPEVFPLLWWQLLIYLLYLDCKVTKIEYNLTDLKYKEMVDKGAQWFNAVTGPGSMLAPSELLIYFANGVRG